MHRLFRRSSLLNMTEGRPLGLLFVFAVPLLIGNLFQQAYNLVDSFYGKHPDLRGDHARAHRRPERLAGGCLAEHA